MQQFVGEQGGIFRLKGREYQFISRKTAKNELHHFYLGETLVTAVWIEYNGIVGALKSGGYLEEFWGDYSVFSTFNDYLTTYRDLKGEVEHTFETMIENYFGEQLTKRGQGYEYVRETANGLIFGESLQIESEDVHISYKTLSTVKKQLRKPTEIKWLKREDSSATDDTIARLITPLAVLKERKDLSWQDNRDYRVILSMEEFYQWLDNELDPCDEVVAFDVETTGLNINRFSGIDPRSDVCVGLVFSTKVGSAVYLPLKHKRFQNLDEDVVIRALRPYLCKKYNSPKLKGYVTHNGIFDAKTMLIYDIVLNVVHDTYALAYVLDPRLGKEAKGLDDLAKKYLGITMLDLHDFFKNGKRKLDIRFDLLPLESVKAYAPCDGDLTKEILPIMYSRMTTRQSGIYAHEVHLIGKVASAEFRGIPVDLELTAKLRQEADENVHGKVLLSVLDGEYKKVIPDIQEFLKDINPSYLVNHWDELKNPFISELMDQDRDKILSGDLKDFSKAERAELETLGDYKNSPELLDSWLESRWSNRLAIQHNKFGLEVRIKGFIHRIEDLAGGPFDINSPKQLREVLFERLKYPAIEQTKNGSPSTAKGTLERLADKYEDGELKYPMAKLILDYREQNKLITDFYDKILQTHQNGYIFPKYNPGGTDTGRFSSSNPNIQQTSRKIRGIFVPEQDYYFIIVDYSQVEYRILAGMAQEYSLIEAMQDPETDVHSLTASMMFGVPQDLVDKDLRKKGKEVNFGSVYGMMERSLAKRVFKSDAPDKVREAKGLYDMYFQNLPNITRFFAEIINKAKKDGSVATLFHRVRPLPMINSDNHEMAMYDERKARNTPVQGTAADILKIAYNKLGDRFETENLDCHIAINVHDEMVIMVHKRYNPWKIVRMCREEMEFSSNVAKQSIEGFPPLYIGATVGSTWADGKDDGLEIPILLTDRKFAEIDQGLHDEPLENPRDAVQREIQLYQAERIRQRIQEVRAYDYDTALKDNAIHGIIDKYFYKETKVLEDIFNNREFFVQASEDYVSEKEEDLHAVMALESDDEDEDVVSVEDDVDVQRGTGEITKTAVSITDDYTVQVVDGTVLIKIRVAYADMMQELSAYLEKNNVEYGMPVILVTGKFLPTRFKLYNPKRLEIIEMIEKYEQKYFQKVMSS